MRLRANIRNQKNFFKFFLKIGCHFGFQFQIGEGVKKTTPKRSASLRCILTIEYTGTKDFISDDSPKEGTP